MEPSITDQPEDLLTSIPDYKINSETGILVAAFLGGPVAAAILIGENYKHFGKPASVRNTWLLSVSGLVALFLVIYYTSILEILSPITIPMLYTGVVSYCFYKYQQKLVKEHYEKDGAIYGFDRSLLAALAGLVIMAPLYYLAYESVNHIGSL